MVAEAAGLAGHVEGADLVLTGEGSIDSQTLAGKTPAGVAEVAARFGVPVIAFAGRLGNDADVLVGNGFAAVVPIIATGRATWPPLSPRGRPNLQRAVATAMRLYRLGQ